MSDYTRVPLRDLKFTRHKRPRPADLLSASINQKVFSERAASYKLPYEPHTSNETPYERLAADKPGAELAPEATIWQVYVDEAKEHDIELVERENDNLDQMLLFAALFSAILTSFIIESKDLLQENTNDVTVTLLLAIAQSQQRLEQGTPQALPLIERPEFSPPITARWINGLWFTALALSLAAALISMLAKEWLATFKGSRPRPAYAHTMVHQERLYGLTRWRALHMIDVLPTMLHLSLLLFSLGLAVYLWTLDKGVAIAEVIITGVTLFFYIGTALLGAIYHSCPFVTQISKYLRRFLQFVDQLARSATSDSKIPIPDIDEETRDSQNLQALWWLTENSRDPLAGDCVCQVLAGITVDGSKLEANNNDSKLGVSVEPGTEDNASGPTGDALESTVSTLGNSMAPARYILVQNLFKAVMTRISDGRLRLPQEPAEYRGMNLALYVNALPKLVYILEQHMATMQKLKKGRSPNTQLAQESVSRLAFDALDNIWTGVYSDLSPDSYSTFSSAELRLIETAVFVHRLKQGGFPANQKPERNPSPNNMSSSEINSDSPIPETVIEIRPSNEPTSDSIAVLREIRARYSRVLSFIGFLLSYHSAYGMQITTRPLIHLLESVHSVFQHSELNPDDHMSTCLPQGNKHTALPGFTISVTPRVAYESHIVEPLSIGDEDGLLAGLVQVISYADIQDTPTIEFAAGCALAAAGPRLFRQWAVMMNASPAYELNRFCSDPECLESALQHWPLIQADQPETLARSTLLQLLVITTISVGFASCNEVAQLPNIAVASLHRRADTVSGRAAWLEISENESFSYLISKLAYYMLESRPFLSENTKNCFIKLLLLDHKEQNVLRNRCLKPYCIPNVLRFATVLPDTQTEVPLVLNEVKLLVEAEVDGYRLPTQYHCIFMQDADGFKAISWVVEYWRTQSPKETFEFMAGIISSLVECSEKSWRHNSNFEEVVISPLLEAVGAVPMQVVAVEALKPLNALIRDLLNILRPFKERNSQIINHKLIDLYYSLERITDWRDDLSDPLFELGQWVDPEAELYFGLEAFLDDSYVEAMQDE